MSKKVLKLAGRRPMLLAVVMATLILGLLFSGWLTPTPSRAQTSNPNPTANQENTNCVATTNAWSGTCPTVITNFSVSPSTIYDPWNTAPTMPTNMIPPVYSPTNIFTQLITYSTTNCETVTNAENVTYSVSGIMWTNFSSPYTNFPSKLTNSFSAQAYVIVTSSDTNICPSPGMVGVGDANSASANAASTSVMQDKAAFALTVTWDPYGIKHECVKACPPNPQGVWRKDVGDGEQVNLSINGLPAGDAVSWAIDVNDGSHGTLSAANGSTTVWTAPGLGCGCTITAYFSDPNTGNPTSRSVSFTVHNPTIINFAVNSHSHDTGTANLGMKVDVYLGPDNVNFYACSVEELDAKWSASGVYIRNNDQSHGSTVANNCTDTVVTELGTHCSVLDDCFINSGGSSYNPTGGVGYEIVSIPCQWSCSINPNSWIGLVYANESGNSSGAPSNTLTVMKEAGGAVAKWSCSVY